MQMITTPTGIDLIGQALIDETRGIKFTKVVFGNGADAGDNPTALSNPLVEVGIIDDPGPTYSDGFVTIQTNFTNAGEEQGFSLTEIGLLAEDPDTEQDVLFAYGYTDKPTWVPAADDYAMEIVETLMVYVGAVENVTAVISESMTYATKAELQEHINDTDNPHQVTKEQVGMGNVPNVSTNDQTPTYSEPANLTALTSGEKLSAAFGKISSAVKKLISHLADTTAHVTDADRSTWNGNHDHSANRITSGELSIERGGTAAGTAKKAREKLGITPDNIGAVKKSGDVLTGNLTVRKDSYPQLIVESTTSGQRGSITIAENNRTGIFNHENSNNETWLSMGDSEPPSTEGLIILGNKRNNVSAYYKLFGQHNLSLLASAIQTMLQEGGISVIKSIQRGKYVSQSSSIDTTITITAVDPSKTVCNLLGIYIHKTGSAEDAGGYIELTSATTLHIVAESSVSIEKPTVSWEVVEFY